MSDDADQPARAALPQYPDRTPELGFALVLEQACEAFETLQAMAGNRLSIVRPDTPPGEIYQSPRATAAVRMALAHSFLFLSNRAYRICEHGKAVLNLPREERRQFLRALKRVVDVRDVNEHGHDLNRKSGQDPTRSVMHIYIDYLCAVDEMSLAILDEQTILMGPLNLFEVYQSVAAMRLVAGFQALQAQGKL